MPTNFIFPFYSFFSSGKPPVLGSFPRRVFSRPLLFVYSFIFFLFIFFNFCKMHEFFSVSMDFFRNWDLLLNWWLFFKIDELVWNLGNFIENWWTFSKFDGRFFSSMYIFWNRWAFFKIDEIFHIREIFVHFIKSFSNICFLFPLTFSKSLNFFWNSWTFF